MLIRAATRGSRLARWQTEHVAELLAAIDPSIRVEPVVVTTTGDQRVDVPIHAIGGKGVFVKEVQAAVLDGRADIAVHSGKDLPALTPDGLVVATVPERADPRDVLIGCRLADLRPGAVVATGSVRRRAQLAAIRPDLVFAEIRGNIDTRLGRAGEFDAIVLAAAALDRLGFEPEIADRLDVDLVVPQVAQGALAVECLEGAAAIRAALAAIEHGPSRRRFDCERAFLSELGGDCDLPAGAYAVVHESRLVLTGVLAQVDGRVVLRDRREGDRGEALGRAVARHLLDDVGGARLLR